MLSAQTHASHPHPAIRSTSGSFDDSVHLLFSSVLHKYDLAINLLSLICCSCESHCDKQSNNTTHGQEEDGVSSVEDLLETTDSKKYT